MGMYHKNKKFVLSIVLLSFLFFSLFAEAAGVPTIISYQGRLADSNGDLLGGTGTTYYFKFSVWDNSTVGSGVRLWPTNAPSSSALSVRSGVFSVNIGDTVAGYPDALDYNFNTASNIYLQVEVSSDNSTFQTLSPRQRVSATPFSQLSSAVSGSVMSSSFGTTTPFSTSVVSIQATSTNSTALSLRSILSQIANLFQIQDSTGTNLFFVNSTGGLFASSTLQATGATNLYSTLNVSGLTTLGNASSTRVSIFDTLYIGGTATTTIRGEANATSTFAGGVQANALNITGTVATSTFARGIDLAGGCFAINGVCVGGGGGGSVSSVANSDGTLTISPTSGSVVASLNLSNPNVWTGLQQFTQASTTRFSVFDTAYFGGTATSTFSSTGALTLASALGVGSGGTGLTATPTFGQILRGTGSGYALVATSTLGVALTDTTGTLAETRGGTNQTSYTTGDIIYSSATNVLSKLGIGTAGFVLGSVSGVPGWVATTTLATISGTLPVSKGGTGWAAIQAGAVPYGNGSSAVSTTTAGTAGNVLALLGGVPTWIATTTFSSGLSYSAGNVTNTGVTSLAGTTNQITASGSTGAVTLSLPSLVALTQASTTRLSIFDTLYVGGSATTTVSQTAVNLPTGGTYQVAGTNVLTGSTLGTGILASSLTSVGALTGGSIASGFGTIATGNTITGTTLNGTTGINTGAGAGTNRIDVNGNLVNIGTVSSGAITSSGALALGANTITSGLINGQTISSAANFTGSVAVGTTLGVTATSTFATTTATQLIASGTITAGSGSTVLTDATGNILHDALVDCADTQILKWAAGGARWGCSSDVSGGSPSLNTVSAATAGATIANANNALVWNWGTLTTEAGMTFGGGTAMTTGNVFTVGGATYVHTTAETGNLAGITFTDSSTNTSGNSITSGLSISSTVNTSGAGTKDINAINVSAPTLTGCATGACSWDGLMVNTQSTGAAATITQNGLNIAAAGIGAGALNGVNIGSITAGAGTETAINVGSGWDTALAVTDSQAVANTLVNFTTSNVGQTGNSLLVQTGSTATVTNGLVRFNFNGVRTTAGNGFQINDISTTLATTMGITANSLTTGNALAISATAAGLTGNALSVTTGSTGVPTNGLVYFNFNGARTAAGTAFQVTDISTTVATTMAITANSLTTGNALVISTNGIRTASSSLSIFSTGITGAGSATSAAGISIAMPSVVVTTGLRYMRFNNAAGTEIGSITNSSASAIAYNLTSDRRLKDNIVDTRYGLADLMKVGVKDFTWNSDGSPDTGFIAQDLYTVYPNPVLKGDNGTDPYVAGVTNAWAIDYGKVTPLLVVAIKDQQGLLGDFVVKDTPGLTTLITEIQAEAKRNPVTIITNKIIDEKKFLVNLVSARVTAIRGYFDEVFADKTHQKTLCVGDVNNEGETCITKTQLDQLLKYQTSLTTTPVVATELVPAPEPELIPIVDSAPTSEPTPTPEPEIVPIVEPAPVTTTETVIVVEPAPVSEPTPEPSTL